MRSSRSVSSERLPAIQLRSADRHRQVPDERARLRRATPRRPRPAAPRVRSSSAGTAGSRPSTLLQSSSCPALLRARTDYAQPITCPSPPILGKASAFGIAASNINRQAQQHRFAGLTRRRARAAYLAIQPSWSLSSCPGIGERKTSPQKPLIGLRPVRDPHNPVAFTGLHRTRTFP